jgi:arsenite methyltransferase
VRRDFATFDVQTRRGSTEAGPQIGFLRADAQRLPLRDETVDAVVSVSPCCS